MCIICSGDSDSRVDMCVDTYMNMIISSLTLIDMHLPHAHHTTAAEATIHTGETLFSCPLQP